MWFKEIDEIKLLPKGFNNKRNHFIMNDDRFITFLILEANYCPHTYNHIKKYLKVFSNYICYRIDNEKDQKGKWK